MCAAGFAVLAKMSGNACPAVGAGAVFTEFIAQDGVPVTFDHYGLAMWTKRAAALAVAVIAGIDVAQTMIEGNLTGQ